MSYRIVYISLMSTGKEEMRIDERKYPSVKSAKKNAYDCRHRVSGEMHREYIVVDDEYAEHVEDRRTGLAEYDWDKCDHTCTDKSGEPLDEPCGECEKCWQWEVDQDIEYLRTLACEVEK